MKVVVISTLIMYENTLSDYEWSNTGRFIIFFLITNSYNKKIKRPNVMELFSHRRTDFLTTPAIRCVHLPVTQHTAIQYSSSCHTRFDILHC
jgi:hypothetical protein